MNTKVNKQETNEVLNKRLYLAEFEYFDGEEYITFNIVDINLDNMNITVAVTNRGRISVITYDLLRDGDCLYFEYGDFYEQIEIDNFTEVDCNGIQD